MYLQVYPNVLAKLQKEVDTKLEPVKNDFVNGMTYEMGEELEYLNQCFMESLRIEAPASLTSH